ncbi:MAG TPA: TldD/PmbA family protein [Thermodesulfovibrionales bacterium]|nr:TldD/PmbA family protein [Thermodesulfovibrionales bacterium]
MRTDREFAFKLLEGAKRGGADLAEVYLKSSRTLSVDVRDQKTDALDSSTDFGYPLRVIREKRMGFSFARERADADSVVERAIESSRWTEQDEWLDLPGPAEQPSLHIFDEAIAAISETKAIEKAIAIEKAALEVSASIKRVRKASASFLQKDALVMNSRGLDTAYSATSCTAQITVVAADGTGSQMGWDFEGSRFLSDVEYERVGKKAATRASLLLGAKTMSAVKCPVILESSVATEFLGIFSSLLSSESVQKGKSLLAHRRGEEVINPLVSIVDDGLMEHKLGSRPFDDEGVPSRSKYLIENGVLHGFLYNVYTARKEGMMSTGNAVRGAFSQLPAVGPTNLYIPSSATSSSPETLCRVMGRGLYIMDAMGVHTANPVSGEFSIGVSGLWIEGGSVKFPVKEAVISGNILDLFKKVSSVGNDLRFYGNMGSPSLLIGPTDISA